MYLAFSRVEHERNQILTQMDGPQTIGKGLLALIGLGIVQDMLSVEQDMILKKKHIFPLFEIFGIFSDFFSQVSHLFFMLRIEKFLWQYRFL